MPRMTSKITEALVAHIDELISKEQLKSLERVINLFEYSRETERVVSELNAREGMLLLIIT